MERKTSTVPGAARHRRRTAIVLAFALFGAVPLPVGWQGQLWPQGSGRAGRLIVFGRYEPKPAAHGGGMVTNTGTEPSGSHLAKALPLRVAAGSPAIDNGQPVPDDGGVDHTGGPGHLGPPDIGAFEHRS